MSRCERRLFTAVCIEIKTRLAPIVRISSAAASMASKSILQ